ncbi:hypothetical protein LTR60_004356, partial [Cryomyces antarcticus]
NLPGGIKYLREVILEDKLGICGDLEKQMEDLVGTFFCEWTEVIKNPEKRALFAQFANTKDAVETVEAIHERGQTRPTYWAKESAHDDFRGTKWSALAWQPLAKTADFADSATGSSQAVKRGDTQLAIFKVKGDFYATQQMCPHKRAFVLSDGLIGDDVASGKTWVSCPMHKRNYELAGAHAGKCGNDDAVNIATFPTEARDDGLVYVKLPPVDELDAVLGTAKWVVRASESEDPYVQLDKKLSRLQLKGRKGLQASHLPNGKGERAAANAILAGGERAAAGMDW